MGLTLFSIFLILTGDVVSYFAGLFGDSSGISAGSSIADMGYAIIIIMLVVVVAVVAVWIYSRFRQDSYGNGMF